MDTLMWVYLVSTVNQLSASYFKLLCQMISYFQHDPPLQTNYHCFRLLHASLSVYQLCFRNNEDNNPTPWHCRMISFQDAFFSAYQMQKFYISLVCN